MMATNYQETLGQIGRRSVVILLTCILVACAGKKEEAAAPVGEAAPAAETPTPPFPVKQYSKELKELQVMAPPTSPPLERSPTRQPAAASGAPLPVPLEEYKVKLGADPVLKIPGPPGELKVWIGAPGYEPGYEGMKQQEDTLPAVGKTAMVTPFAPGLMVEPNKSICMKTTPKGAEVRFTLTPIKPGTYKVGADVALYDSNDCSGTPVPKAATSLQVDVRSDIQKSIAEHLGELWDVFWKKLLEFWGAAVAAFFAALLFVFRKKLKKWFGFSG